LIKAAGAAVLIGFIVQIGNERSAVVIPSRADIGVVNLIPSIEVFDTGNYPQNMGSCLKTLPFSIRESAPMEGIMKIIGIGEKRFGQSPAPAFPRDVQFSSSEPAFGRYS
jgi:hypothetical protein